MTGDHRMRKPRSSKAAAQDSDKGDRPAALTAEEFAARFEESARLLWTLAAGVLGDRSDVEDVLQEAALIGIQRLDRFEPGTSFGAWMGRIVRFVALNQVRLRRRRRTRPADPGSLDLETARAPAAGTGVGPRGELLDDAGHFDDDLTRALGEIRPIARACLLLKIVLDLEYQEIGAILGIPRGTAMSHVHRARLHLRRRLASSSPADTGRIVREP